MAIPWTADFWDFTVLDYEKGQWVLSIQSESCAEILTHRCTCSSHVCSEFFGDDHNDDNPLTNLIMSDKAHFHMDGFTNAHNCIIWATENPMALHEKELHPQGVTIWCGICSTNVIGPFFFEDETGATVTVTCDHCWEMITIFLARAVKHMTVNHQKNH